MSVKTAGVGQFQIPTAPAALTAVAQSGSANTLGSAVSFGNAPSAMYITGVHVGAATTQTPTYVQIQILVAASIVGSVIVSYGVSSAAANSVATGFRPIYPPIPVANGAAITVKSASSVASAVNWGVSLECIAQSNVVDDGIPITTVTTLTNLPAITANWLTAAGTAADFGTEVASAVWQDAVAGDFTVASSIGKALYIANVAPGGAGGHFISGSNAGTTTLGALTVTGVTTHTGNFLLSDGLTISAPSTADRAGIDVTGNGAGAAMKLAAGATGKGIAVTTTAGDALSLLPTAGHAIVATGNGTTKHGAFFTGGGTTSFGVRITSPSGNALDVTSTGGNGHGANISGNGSGYGINIGSGVTGTYGVYCQGFGSPGYGIWGQGGGAGAGIGSQGGTTGPGVLFNGGATSGSGAEFKGVGSGSGLLLTGTANTKYGLEIVNASGHAVRITPGNTGRGVFITGAAASGATAAGEAIFLQGGAASTTGGGTAAPGFKAVGGSGAASTNGAATGAQFIGGGTTTVSGGNGLTLTGTGDEDGLEAVGAGTGVDIRADITGDITGSLSGSVGSLTINNDKTGYLLSAIGSAALTESYAADGVAPTLNQAIYEILQFQQEKSISGTTMTINKLDGSTPAMTFTLNATTPTSITRAT